MRTFLSSDEIASVWVSQSQPAGRCSSRMSFEGTKFYSYGTTVAEVIKHRGKTAFLVNAWGYSDSTSRHVNLVRCAIPKDARRFEVPGVHRGSYAAFNDPVRILKAWKHGADSLIADSATAREPKQSRLIIEAYEITRKMRDFAAFMGRTLNPYPVALPLPEDAIRQLIRERDERNRQRREREPEAQREHEARVQLIGVMQKHFPDKEFTTRDAYKLWRKHNRKQEQP